MKKYQNLVEEIVKHIGGKDNVVGLTHCVTRLRFTLKDEKRANEEALKSLDGVITVMKAGGQFQVVIGNHVTDVYDVVCDVIGIQNLSAVAEKKEKQTIGQVLLDFMSGIMTPVIGMLCASGMIKGILSVFTYFGLLGMESGIYQLLNACGDAMFYFFPILIGYTTAKKLKMEPFLGLLIGAALLYPNIQSVDLQVLGMSVNVAYASTLLPVIFTVLFAWVLYRPLQKIIPDMIKAFFVPMIVLAVAVPVGFVLIGPFMNGVGDILGNFIANVVEFNPTIAGFLVGSLYQIMVIFGIHGALGAVAFVQLASGQPSFLGFMAGSSFSQTAVVSAIYMRSKDAKLKSIALPAIISGVFGVTEPAIYGITLPRMKFFIISCIGSGLTGAFLGYTGTLLWQLTGLGIFTIPGFIGGSVPVATIMFNVIIALLIGIIFSFVATYFLYREEASVEEQKHVNENHVRIASPMKGEVIALSKAEDQAFASGAIGDGICINPTDGKVVAPIDGVVTTLFPSLHAIGITGNRGEEVLIHVGFNTVSLNGQHFTAHIQQGDRVTQGQKLLDVDVEAITALGLSVQTPIILTNSNDMVEIMKTKELNIHHNEMLMSVVF
ncbi:MAG: beta-glucoside-specific PTS transporter subunit IIABC [Erysipelotrichaceae bacterium]